MKAGAWLINTARGEVVDEAALLQALQSGHLAGAALDVLDEDSVWERRAPADHPLIRYAREHDNLLLTPHMGGYGRDSIRKTRRFLVEKFIHDLETG
jgi:D-3-phosphoglycerate dehydrogenase